MRIYLYNLTRVLLEISKPILGGCVCVILFIKKNFQNLIFSAAGKVVPDSLNTNVWEQFQVDEQEFFGVSVLDKDLKKEVLRFPHRSAYKTMNFFKAQKYKLENESKTF